ncbi:MAG TPA: O-antigen polymerase [Prosthecobacter sp.]|nr:O-antigen polymerase [Prosthecobacter sp.]
MVTLCGLTTQYPLLTAACAWTLPICASLLLFKGESPILFACCAMQWLQVVAAVFYCDLYNMTMDSVLEAPEVDAATWLCLAGVLCLAAGMRSMLSSWGRGGDVAKIIEAEVGRFDLFRLFQIWLFVWILGTIAEAVGWYVTSLHQFLVPVTNLKWVFFFIICYRALLQDRGFGMMSLMIAVEFFSGFLGFFSSYKEGLIMFLIAAATVRRAMNIKLKIMGATVILLGAVTSVFWSAIKQEYRLFVNASQHQDMAERFSQRISWLEDRLGRMDAKTFDNGMRALVARVQYVTLFGHTLNHVPHFEPHSKGELWLGAVKHIVTPRIVFRNKAAVDDSDRARRFTGLNLSGKESSTSIGVGYMAESYADFGFVGMFVPVCLLGALMGRIYQVVIRNRHSALLGTAIATAMLFSVLQAFATSNAKILGSLIVLSLAYWALNKAFGGQLMRWLKRAS